MQSVLQAAYPNEDYTCVYNTARGSITMSAIRSFRIHTDDHAIELTSSIGAQFPGWVDHNNQLITADVNNLMSMNEILRHSEPSPEITLETKFIDLLNVHNIYTHCPNLGHYSTIGVRGDTPITKIPVSSSLGCCSTRVSSRKPANYNNKSHITYFRRFFNTLNATIGVVCILQYVIQTAKQTNK